MEITGKLLSKLPPVNGTSSKGAWTKQDVLIETAEQFPKKVCISFWKNVPEIQAIAEGTTLTCHINIESREYNSKWYTDVQCWKFESGQVSAPKPSEQPNLTPSNDSFDDLPF